MAEFFIQAHSFAAPFCSDESTAFVEADTAKAALEKFIKTYRHPTGLHAANVYTDANAMHKGASPVVKYLSYVAQALIGVSIVTPEMREQLHKKHGNTGSII